MPVSSIFQLRKTTPNSAVLSEAQVRTVNFENNEISQPEIAHYFESRSLFLQACYEFAKEAKLQEDFDFSDKKSTQAKLSLWLNDNQKASMITGSEFEVLTTKVIESIKSIQANKYLKDLEQELQFLVYSKISNEKDDKESRKHAKKHVVSLDELKRISEEEIKTIFKFELVALIDSFLTLIEFANRKGIFVSDEHIIQLLEDLTSLRAEAIQTWQKSFKIVKAKLDSTNFKEAKIANIAKYFVLNLYFHFDLAIRDVEKQYLDGINTNLNYFQQQFGNELLTQDNNSDWNEDRNKHLKDSIYALWSLDWSKSKSVEIFREIVSSLIEGKEVNVKLIPSKDAKNFFLRHPKSAPSFPSQKDRAIRWNAEHGTSHILRNNCQQFDTGVFYDSLLSRCRRIITNSTAFKVAGFVTKDNGNLKWDLWLRNIINADDVNWLEQEVSNHYDASRVREELPNPRRMKKRTLNSNKPKNQYKAIIFQWGANKENSRLPRITTGKKTLHQPAKELVLIWILSHTKDLTKFHPELALLRQLRQDGSLDSKYIYKWLELTTCEEEGIKEKLLFRTEKRRASLNSKIEHKPHFDVDQAISKLKKYEKHLLLDHDHEEYKLFDKQTFVRYMNLSELIFEALFDAKVVQLHKSRLAELKQNVQQTVPLKISRMTATKPQGKSTLVFPIKFEIHDEEIIKAAQIDTTQPNILMYPVNLGLNGGGEVKIVDTWDKALKEISKPATKRKYSKVYAGFLNGSGDNRFGLEFVNVMSSQRSNISIQDLERFKSQKQSFQVVRSQYISETEKGYALFDQFELMDERGASIIDPYREKGKEQYGGTNPAGYPKLYFFLVPDVCNNLIVPVKTNFYYLTKYTPYHHLKRYFELERGLSELDSNSSEYRSRLKEILDLRCKLRFYYRISSIELDLIKDYNLKDNQIIPQYTAKAHMQFANPRKELRTNPVKNDYTKYKHIISIDLGEKHLAVATISSIDWNSYENGEFKKALKPKRQFSLPMSYKHLETISDGDEYWMTYSFLSEQVKHIPSEEDQVYDRFMTIDSRYKMQQKQFGVVNKNLKSARKDLTDKLAQRIAAQIIKLTVRYDAAVVFENLATGFGRRDAGFQLYSQIRRLVALKLGEIGRLDTSMVKAEADLDNFASYDLSRGGLSFAAAAYTSKQCANCGYLPRIRRITKEGKTLIGVESDYSQWDSGGIIKYLWQGEEVLRIESPSGPDSISVIDKGGDTINNELDGREYYYRNKTSINRKNQLQELKDLMYSSTRYEKKTSPNQTKAIDSFIIKHVLASRPQQETFICPNCGLGKSSEINADYHASYNIGLHFIAGMKLMEDRVDKKGLGEEILATLCQDPQSLDNVFQTSNLI